MMTTSLGVEIESDGRAAYRFKRVAAACAAVRLKLCDSFSLNGLSFAPSQEIGIFSAEAASDRNLRSTRDLREIKRRTALPSHASLVANYTAERESASRSEH